MTISLNYIVTKPLFSLRPYFSIAMIALISLSISACGGDDGGSDNDNDNDSNTPQAELEQNTYLPADSSAHWYYSYNATPNYYAAAKTIGGATLDVLVYPTDGKEYYQTDDNNIALRGFFFPEIAVSSLGSFTADIMFNQALTLWSANSRENDKLNFNASGTVNISPTFGQHNVSVNGSSQFIGEESVTVPYGTFDALHLSVNISVSATIEGGPFTIPFRVELWLVEGLGIVKRVQEGTTFELSSYSGPFQDKQKLENANDSKPKATPGTSAAPAAQPAKAGQTVTFTPIGGATSGLSIISPPAKGALNDNGDGTFTYNPGNDFNELGENESTELSYSYSDGETTYTKTIKVSGANDKPVSEPFILRGAQEAGVIRGQLKVNDLDVNDRHQFSIITQADLGSISIDGGGYFTFTPSAQFPELAEGETKAVFFTYVAVDNSGKSNSNTSTPSKVTLIMTGGDFGDNTRPEAQDLSLPAMSADLPITERFEISDHDEDNTLSIKIVSQPEKGTLSLNNDGTFTFTPGPDFALLPIGSVETVSFSYQAVDSSGYANAESDIKTVTLQVLGHYSAGNSRRLSKI